MGIFHGSGLLWISDEICKSNAGEFLKEVFPVSFIQVSIHIIGLSILGIVAIFLAQGARNVLALIVALVLADVTLAFYLGATIPAVLLLFAALCFLAAMFMTDGASK